MIAALRSEFGPLPDQSMHEKTSVPALIEELYTFLRQADAAGLMLGPHFAMELHVHLAAAYPTEPWVEHFEWLEPLFNERIEIANGRMLVPTRPGLGLSLSEQARAWTRESVEVGQRA
jgi:L-alanine-DL-glutamate epimerase-like enolase superfamily enzyme